MKQKEAEAFAKQLAIFLVEKQVQKSVQLGLGASAAEEWRDLRQCTPLFGYPTVEEAEQQLLKWLLESEEKSVSDPTEIIQEIKKHALNMLGRPIGTGWQEVLKLCDKANEQQSKVAEAIRVLDNANKFERFKDAMEAYAMEAYKNTDDYKKNVKRYGTPKNLQCEWDTEAGIVNGFAKFRLVTWNGGYADLYDEFQVLLPT